MFVMRYIVLICLCLGFWACSNPLARVYTHETVQEDLTRIEESSVLDSLDFIHLKTALIRANVNNKPLEGRTYEDILADEKSK